MRGPGMREQRPLALFIYSLAWGGAQRRTVTLANAFAARGFQVDLIIVRSQGGLSSELSPAVRLIALDQQWHWVPWSALGESRRRLAGIAALANYLRQTSPVALLSVANHANRTAVWARALARTRTKLVLRVSNHLSRADEDTPSQSSRSRLRKIRRYYPWADGFIAVSHGVAEDLICVTGVDPSRVTTIYNPIVDLDLQKRAQEPPDHPWFAPHSPPVILGVGRLMPQKDFATLLRAFARVRATRPARLVLLGDGKQRPELEVLAYTLGIRADVALLGFVANPFPYMTRAALLAVSSLWEGLPGVLIEAMACGCPVVSTNCPSGPAEILAHGVYGPLVPMGNDEALAQAMCTVLSAPRASERLQTRAAQFSVTHATNRYLDVLLDSRQDSDEIRTPISLAAPSVEHEAYAESYGMHSGLQS